MSDPVSLFRLHEAGYRAMAQLSVCCSPMFLFTTFPDADEVLIERLRRGIRATARDAGPRAGGGYKRYARAALAHHVGPF